MTAASVREQTASVYAPEGYLNDTLVGIDGAGRIEAYFGHTIERARLLKVEFLERAPVGTDWYVRWRMTVAADGLNGGEPVVTYGVTQFRFDARRAGADPQGLLGFRDGALRAVARARRRRRARARGRRAVPPAVSLLIDLCERGLIPGSAHPLRHAPADGGTARHRKLLTGAKREFEEFRRRLAGLRESPVAIETARANEQHYEVPAAFFQRVLGPHLKYSCCWYGDGARSLGEAEEAMLRLTGARAELADGQRILELGCGWGSLTLWMAAQYPAQPDHGGLQFRVPAAVHPGPGPGARPGQRGGHHGGCQRLCHRPSASTGWCPSRCSSTCATTPP